MSRSQAIIAVLVLAVVLPQGCVLDDAPRISAAGDRDGLTLTADLGRTSDSLVLETTVRNTRAGPVHLDADQCGRVTEVILARTAFQPEGETHEGSLGAVKEFVLDRQRFLQHPDRFHPRRPGGGPEVPECARPSEPVAIPPGGTIQERWELPLDMADSIQVVGSENTVVRAEIVESEAPDRLRFLDIVPTGEADDARKDRNVRVELRTSNVLQQAATKPAVPPSLGERFDRMVEDPALRGFLLAQPADSWRQADLQERGAAFEFKAITTSYERAITATVSNDGADVGDLKLPGPGDRTRVFERRAATLPPGIERIPEGDDLVLTEDVIPNPLILPSGAVVGDGALAGDADQLPFAAEPGSYPVHVTLARLPGTEFDNVALATLVISDAPTVTWKEASVVGVDGGTAAFISAEGSKALGRMIDGDVDVWSTHVFDAFDSLVAHDSVITEYPIDAESNLVLFNTGYGDGGYPVYVGLDAAGRPTRYVIDFLVIHLAWPSA